MVFFYVLDDWMNEKREKDAGPEEELDWVSTYT